MKIIVDKETSDYIEAKNDGNGNVDISIRAKKDSKSTMIISAKLNMEILDKLISELILMKSRAMNEK